jgi:hypothetical protein
MLGGGEYNRMTRTHSLGGKALGLTVAKMDFDIFA